MEIYVKREKGNYIPTGNPTGYYDGWGMWKSEDGSLKYELDNGIETVIYKGNKYIVHPAFETNLDNGGWSSDLSGLWFAKFEMGGTSTTLESTYGTACIQEQKRGQQYTCARQATYGYTGTTDTDGNTSFMSSHMSKNSEWGAVAYLAHSQYGRNGKEITINSNSKYYRGGGSGTAYITNINQSTTGNVYGVYDMSGGTWEYVAISDCEVSSKYETKYIHSIPGGIFSYGKIGDATKEVVGWFSDWCICTDHPDYVYLERGGFYFHGSSAGIFAYSNDQGINTLASFRAVLCK